MIERIYAYVLTSINQLRPGEGTPLARRLIIYSGLMCLDIAGLVVWWLRDFPGHFRHSVYLPDLTQAQLTALTTALSLGAAWGSIILLLVALADIWQMWPVAGWLRRR